MSCNNNCCSSSASNASCSIRRIGSWLSGNRTNSPRIDQLPELVYISGHVWIPVSDNGELKKYKLEALENQNAFSQITVGSTVITANSPTANFSLVAGANITLIPNQNSRSITITSTGGGGTGGGDMYQSVFATINPSGGYVDKAVQAQNANYAQSAAIASSVSNYPLASENTAGGVYLGYPQSGRNYPLQISVDGEAYTYVPWTDSGGGGQAATATTLGSIKIGYPSESAATKHYAVELDSLNRAYVYVPWVSGSGGLDPSDYWPNGDQVDGETLNASVAGASTYINIEQQTSSHARTSQLRLGFNKAEINAISHTGDSVYPAIDLEVYNNTTIRSSINLNAGSMSLRTYGTDGAASGIFDINQTTVDAYFDHFYWNGQSVLADTLITGSLTLNGMSAATYTKVLVLNTSTGEVGHRDYPTGGGGTGDYVVNGNNPTGVNVETPEQYGITLLSYDDVNISSSHEDVSIQSTAGNVSIYGDDTLGLKADGYINIESLHGEVHVDADEGIIVNADVGVSIRANENIVLNSGVVGAAVDGTIALNSVGLTYITANGVNINALTGGLTISTKDGSITNTIALTQSSGTSILEFSAASGVHFKDPYGFAFYAPSYTLVLPTSASTTNVTTTYNTTTSAVITNYQDDATFTTERGFSFTVNLNSTPSTLRVSSPTDGTLTLASSSPLSIESSSINIKGNITLVGGVSINIPDVGSTSTGKKLTVNNTVDGLTVGAATFTNSTTALNLQATALNLTIGSVLVTWSNVAGVSTLTPESGMDFAITSDSDLILTGSSTATLKGGTVNLTTTYSNVNYSLVTTASIGKLLVSAKQGSSYTALDIQASQLIVTSSNDDISLDSANSLNLHGQWGVTISGSSVNIEPVNNMSITVPQDGGSSNSAALDIRNTSAYGLELKAIIPGSGDSGLTISAYTTNIINNGGGFDVTSDTVDSLGTNGLLIKHFAGGLASTIRPIGVDSGGNVTALNPTTKTPSGYTTFSDAMMYFQHPTDGWIQMSVSDFRTFLGL